MASKSNYKVETHDDKITSLIDGCINVFTELCRKLKSGSDDKLASARNMLKVAPDISADGILAEMIQQLSDIAEENKLEPRSHWFHTQSRRKNGGII